MNFKGITFDLPDTGMLQWEHNSFNSSTAQSWILAMFKFFSLISLWRIAGSPRSNDKIDMLIRKASLLAEVSHDEAKMRESRETSANTSIITILNSPEYSE